MPFNLVTSTTEPSTFDKSFSTFTAPQNGFYHFDFALTCLDTGAPIGNRIVFSLCVNDVAYATAAYTTSGTPSELNTVSAYWQGVLKQGDKVTLKAVDASGTATSAVVGPLNTNVLPYPSNFSAWWLA